MEKICFVASAGGHLEEISRLVEVKETYSSFLVTEKSEFNQSLFCDKVYYLPQINRKEPLAIFKFIKIFFLSLKIMKQENPDCIISTGALATCPICFVAKWKKKKIVYIESFARIATPSLTGKIMYKLKMADLFLVQWEEMLEIFPEAVYSGRIF